MFQVKKEWELQAEHEGLVVGLFDKPEKFSGPLAKLDEQFSGQLTELVKAGDISAKLNSISKVHSLGKIGAKRIWFVGLGKEKELTFHKLEKAFGKLAKEIKGSKVLEAALYLDSFLTEQVDVLDAAHAASEAFALATYQFDGYRQKSNEPERKLETLTVYCDGATEEEVSASLHVGYAFGKSTNSARTLVNTPGNMLTATDMANYAIELARKYDFEVEILDKADIEKLGMGAFLAVNQGINGAAENDCLEIPGQR